MNDWPKHYMSLPMPSFQGDDKEVVKLRWEGVVHSRARIHDPDFHGGKTEAIRMIVRWGEEETSFVGRKWMRKVAVPGPWIEFRNFKEANQFVQAYKRLGQ